MPKRFQRKRTLGYHLPPGVVCVTRPSVFGNPFTAAGCRAAGYIGTDAQIRAMCVCAFKAWLGPAWRDEWQGPESESRRAKLLAALPSLRGRDLACWCGLDQPCHAEVLLELANRGEA